MRSPFCYNRSRKSRKLTKGTKEMNAMKRFALIGTALLTFLTGCGREQENSVNSQALPKASADIKTVQNIAQTGSIANWKTMQNRLNTLESYGIPTEFHSYEGLPHGFGLGTGTVADDWIYDAVTFWEEQFSGNIPTKRKPANLQNWLMTKTKNAHGNDYDLNSDNRWDVFDLCLINSN